MKPSTMRSLYLLLIHLGFLAVATAQPPVSCTVKRVGEDSFRVVLWSPLVREGETHVGVRLVEKGNAAEVGSIKLMPTLKTADGIMYDLRVSDATRLRGILRLSFTHQTGLVKENYSDQGKFDIVLKDLPVKS